MERTHTLARRLLVVVVVIALALGIAACAGDAAETPDPVGTDSGGSSVEPDAPADDPVVALVETKCSMCHPVDRVWSATKTREEWVATMDRMRTNGLVVTDEEYEQIVDHLSDR